MASSPKKVTRNVLRIIGCVAAISYLVFIISELQSIFKYGIPEEESIFTVFTTVALLLLFFVGFYFMWKKEALAGFLWILWYALLLVMVRWVWYMAGVTVLMGAPICILGILLVIYGMRNRLSN